MRLEGKVALITGAAHGMGAEDARLFAREGAKVAIADIREEDARKVEAEIAGAGGEAMVIMLDVSKEEQWEQAVAAVVAKFGKLDILVNNAGISGSGESDSSSTDAWDRLIDINAKSVFLGMKHAIPEMEKIGGGAIVNISSISGLVGQESIHPGYNASKGAVRLVTKATAVQHAKSGIRVNSVNPAMGNPEMVLESLGLTGSDLSALRPRGGSREGGGAGLTGGNPILRRGEMEDVANAVAFLACDDSSFFNGADFALDGGISAGTHLPGDIPGARRPDSDG